MSGYFASLQFEMEKEAVATSAPTTPPVRTTPRVAPDAPKKPNKEKRRPFRRLDFEKAARLIQAHRAEKQAEQAAAKDNEDVTSGVDQEKPSESSLIVTHCSIIAMGSGIYK